jgi:hypothetical protein
MRFLASNWIFILFVGGMVWMHLAHGRSRRSTPDEPAGGPTRRRMCRPQAARCARDGAGRHPNARRRDRGDNRTGRNEFV